MRNVQNNSETTVGKAPGGVTGRGFVKGRSGNPGGRPRKNALDDALRQLADAPHQDGKNKAQALAEVLFGLALSGDIRAAQLICERTQGKPQQAVAFSDGGIVLVHSIPRPANTESRTLKT